MIWLILPSFTLWFWVISAAALIFFISFIEKEWSEGAFICLLVYLAVFSLLGDVWHIFRWMQENPFRMTMGSISYVLLGFVWGIVHWLWSQNRDRRKYDEKRYGFMNEKGLLKSGDFHKDVEMPDKYLKEWAGVCDRRYASYRKYFEDKKRAIVNRMIYWPFSVLSAIFRDLLVDFYTMLLNQTKAIFVMIEKAAWAGTADDFRNVSEDIQVEAKRAAESIVEGSRTTRPRGNGPNWT